MARGLTLVQYFVVLGVVGTALPAAEYVRRRSAPKPVAEHKTLWTEQGTTWNPDPTYGSVIYAVGKAVPSEDANETQRAVVADAAEHLQAALEDFYERLQVLHPEASRYNYMFRSVIDAVPERIKMAYPDLGDPTRLEQIRKDGVVYQRVRMAPIYFMHRIIARESPNTQDAVLTAMYAAFHELEVASVPRR